MSKKKFNKVLVTHTQLLVTICFLLLLFSLSSCFKEKTLAPPANKSIGQTAVIPMGPDYANQFFYSLETNQVLSSNSRFAYDLMFDCDAGKFNIWLNTAKFMSVIRTGKTDLANVSLQDTTGKQWYYELGEYNVDSNAIGNWWDTLTAQPTSKGEVFLINLGIDNAQTPFGFIKLKVNNFTGNSYSITYSSLTTSDSGTIEIAKDATRNYRYLTFTNTATILNNIEPDKSTWDFCFTHYSVIFYEPYYLPYQVTGVLHNPSRVSAYMDSTVIFDSVKISNFNFSRLQTRRDAIGYDWKRYVLGDYTTKTWYTYFIKAADDKYYKLRFLDFKKDGVKGYPTFEFYQL